MTRFVRLLLVFTAVLLLAVPAAGANNTEEAVQTIKNPSNLLAAYASVTGTICAILFIFGGYSILKSILQSIRISGALCVITSPFIYMMFESSKMAYGMVASGFFGVVLITLFFWRDFYPSRQRRNTETEEE